MMTSKYIFNRIRGMIIFVRSWYVIYQLRKTHLKKPVVLGKTSISSGETWSDEEKFLENISRNMFFIIPRTLESRENRMRKDKLIIDDFASQSPMMIEEKPWNQIFSEEELDQLKIGHSDMAIRITGAGYTFSHLSNAFVAFCKEYKIIGAIIWILFVIFLWPVIKPILLPVLCKYMNTLEYCKV